MRPQLLGYLLDALEPAERDALEQQISRDPTLSAELESMRDALDPLLDDDQPIQAPGGLAQRTCHFVAARSQIERDPGRSPGSSQWSMQDIGVAAGIFVAASMLFFPAVVTSRNNARMAQCDHNLATLGSAFSQYASFFSNQLPPIAPNGNLSVAGIYAPRLAAGGFIEQPSVVVCPSSPQADDRGKFRIPTLAELRRASGQKLIELQRKMGGGYAYALGHISTPSGEYISPYTEYRETFPVLADAPNESGAVSDHHGRRGTNTLFEDGHVQFLTSSSHPDADGQRDDFYLNDDGVPAAGLHREDAVLGPSATSPIPPALSIDSSER